MNHETHSPAMPRWILLAVLLCVAASTSAATFTVGSPSGSGQPCTHGTIQSAIDAANSSPGADTILLTRSLTYEPEANTIDTTQELTIEGGYATCTSAADTGTTIVSGAGGAHAPVFTILASTGALIRLRRLAISGGDVDGTGTGGGIRFEGDGILDIADSTITQNVAGFGGGIYARGAHSNAELVIGANVLVSGNTARYAGGGIYSRELEMSMLEPGSTLFNNEATGVGGNDGFGGGLYVHASDRHSYAYIGSGLANVGAIAQNSARYGGGVALGGQSTNDEHSYAELHLFTTDPDQRARIRSNSASVKGGAFYARTFASTFDGSIDASVRVWNADIEDNIAPDGAVAFLEGDEPAIGYPNAASFQFNFGTPPADAVPCATGSHCGRIHGNAADDGSNVTDGAIFSGSLSASVCVACLPDSPNPPLQRGGVVIDGNVGGRLADGDGSFNVANTLIAGNAFSQELIRLTDGRVKVLDATIAGNTIGATHVLSSGSMDLTIHRSLLWQPGRILLNRSGGTFDSADNMVNEIDSFGGNFNGALVANPRFVDPDHGDYSLRAGSPAIDMAPPISGDDRDTSGNPRDQDLPITDADSGVRDIGAFERQSLQPIVLNGDFDAVDLRLWNPVMAGVASRDGAQNASGAAGSASAHILRAGTAFGQETPGLSQCIHLPGPAIYALNGWGRGTGTMVVAGDVAQLRWEYRRNGGETCSDGAPDASGTHQLTSSASWRRPADPSLIEISRSNWGGSPSILVTLVAAESGISTEPRTTRAWFDGITLDIVPLDDSVFADGFEG